MKLKLIYTNALSDEGPCIGDCWYGNADDLDLTKEYITIHKGKRLPIWVQLPGKLPTDPGWPFCVDHKETKSSLGWTVKGDPPNITVTPSIYIPGIWHGFITNGEIITL